MSTRTDPSTLASDADSPGAGFRVIAAALAWGVPLLFLGVLGRVTQVQLWPAEELLAQVTPRVTTVKEVPLRGDLLDRRGRLLAGTRFAERVILDPTLVKDQDKTIVSLAEAIGVSTEELGGKIIAAMQENARRAARIEELRRSGVQIPPAPEPVRVEVPEPELTDAEREAIARGTSFDDRGRPEPLFRYPIRYLSLSELLPAERVRAVRAAISRDKLRGVSLEKRAVREYTGGPEAAEIVGKVGWDGKHITGSESRWNKDLSGEPGKVGYVRDAKGAPLWVEAGQVKRAEPGKDIRLALDLEVQRMVTEELTAGVEECDAQGGRCVVLDSRTGEVLAMVDVHRPIPGLAPLPTMTKEQAAKRGAVAAKKNEVYNSRLRYEIVKPDLDEKGRPKPPGLGRNRCVEDVYEPGSTFKPFVWSVITELGRARPDEVFDTEGGRWITPTGKPISDVHKAATMTWRDVLVNSSNIGMIKGAQRLSPREFHDALTRFGFGAKTGIGLGGESGGIVTPPQRWSVFTHTSNAYGNEVAVTALQMARAFSVFARDGDLAGTIARPRLTSPSADEPPGIVYRVLPASIALSTRDAMRGVTASMETKYAKAAPDGTPWKYSMFGKSGTARVPCPPIGYLQHQYVPSFIAAGPTEAPRIVVAVVIDDPGPARIRSRTYFGASTAGPVVRRVMERTLTYLGERPSIEVDVPSIAAAPVE